MHAFMAAVLLRMARLDSLDGNAEPQPPNSESAQVEETIGRGEGHAIVGTNGLRQAAFLKQALKGSKSALFTNGLRQAAFLKQALKGSKSALFLDRLHGLAEQEVTAGVIGNGQGVAISFISEHELALVVGAP